MSTADKTKTINANALRGGLRANLVTRYRWIVSVFTRRNRFSHDNDLQGLNRHQLRDLGLDAEITTLSSRQEKLQQAKLNAVMLLMGVNGR